LRRSALSQGWRIDERACLPPGFFFFRRDHA
jgi:hypothetical protein